MSMLRAGTLAYFDSFAGLVPCRVLAVRDLQADDAPGTVRFNLTHGGASTRYMADIELTADRGCYRTGERMAVCSLHVVPRDAVRRRQYSSMIGIYHVEVTQS